ncbi:MAG: hypothetical protein RL264_1070 [Bacteroidota bacterium]|jgi:hypothetical protein
MKSLKILLASLLLSTAAMAQVKTAEERATLQTEKMTQELSLTAEQKEKVYTINVGINKKMDGVRASNMTEQEKNKAMNMNNEARDMMMKDVLTAEQYEKYSTRRPEAVQMKKAKPNGAELKQAVGEEPKKN